MRILPALILLVLGATAARGAIVFQGYMLTTGKPLFVLSVDREKTSGWLAVGQEFAGVAIIAFDAKGEALTVEQAGQRQVLHLADAKVQPGGETAKPPVIKPIVISIGGQESISIGDDAAMMVALKAKFTELAALKPQPALIIQPPPDTDMAHLSAVLDLLRVAGFSRFSIRSESTPKRPATASPQPSAPTSMLEPHAFDRGFALKSPAPSFDPLFLLKTAGPSPDPGFFAMAPDAGPAQ